MTAVATAATPIPPSTWLPIVLGSYELEGADDPVLGLVLRMYNEINAALKDGQVICPPPQQVEEIEDFCIGYMMGVDLDDRWDQDDLAVSIVAPIAILAGEEPLNHPDDPEPIEDEEGFMQKAREQLPKLVLEAYAALEVYRRPPVAGAGVYRRGDSKVGRNDPCPCGSGKKYKKCCGR